MAAGKHGEALPAAQSCLRCAVDIYGPSTVQLVPAYLLLAEANMGRERKNSVASFTFFSETGLFEMRSMR